MTHTDILPELRTRKSNVSLDPIKTISSEDMDALFEAARWAPSSYNVQPWRWMFAHRGTPKFDRIWALLVPYNQTWTKFASVLIIAAADTIQTHHDGTKGPNRVAFHDAGLANMSLAVEATRRGLGLRMMAGFNLDEARKLMPEGVEPICIIGLGIPNDGSHLPPEVSGRDAAPRQRKPVAELIIK